MKKIIAWLKKIAASKDIVYIFPFIVFVVQLIIIPKHFLLDLLFLVLFAPILYFGYLKKDEEE
jgi:hypothetical protein